MTYYAHTSELLDGSRDPDQSNWQPLRQYSPSEAGRAVRFAYQAQPEDNPVAAFYVEYRT